MIIITQEQLTALVRIEVEKVLAQMGQIQATIPARKAWELVGGRRRFELLCDKGLIIPLSVSGYKGKRYDRQQVINASQEKVKTSTKKIKL